MWPMVALLVGVLAAAGVVSTAMAWRVASAPPQSSARRLRVDDDLPGWSLSRTASVAAPPTPLQVDGWLDGEARPAATGRQVLRLFGLVVLLAGTAAALAGVALGVARLAGLELAHFLGQ
jgi:hypothetical protein